VLHNIIFVAHSVAQIAAKTAQNTPFRCSTMYRKLLICFRWGYYLANFKTAGFNRSPTPPLMIIGHLSTPLGTNVGLTPPCDAAQGHRSTQNPPPARR
jgi:hypothetical protein